MRIDPALPDRLTPRLSALPRLRGFGIVRDGKLVYEYYRPDTRADLPVNVASVTKSVLAIIVGIALDKGVLASADQPLTDFFPELQEPGVDPRSREIRLHHLLSMTAGWEVNPIDTPPAVPIDSLRRRVALDPGETFQYDNASSHLIAIALSRVMGKTVEAFAREHLFGPLDIHDLVWSTDMQGRTLGWHMLAINLHDMLKIGQLVLDRGEWRGRRIVSAAWIDAMLTRRSAGGPTANLPYGYQWYIHRTPDRQHVAVMGIGFGGQLLYVVPDLRLVIALTHSREERGADLAFLREIVMPAINR